MDVLRQSHVSALDYYVRRQPDPKLLALFHCDSNTRDSSRYGSIMTAPTVGYITPTDSWNTWGTYAKTNACSIQIKHGDLSQDFTLELYFYRDNVSWSSVRITIGELQIVTGYPYSNRSGVYYDSSGVSLLSNSNGYGYESWCHHLAISYARDSKAVCVYDNGVKKTLCQLPGVISADNTIISIAPYQAGRFFGIAELRIYNKYVGDSASYPVPVNPYTGYEQI